MLILFIVLKMLEENVRDAIDYFNQQLNEALNTRVPAEVQKWIDIRIKIELLTNKLWNPIFEGNVVFYF